MLETLITSKTRLRLLIKFFVNLANDGYLNGLANEFGESTNSIRKELNNLAGAGYLKKRFCDNKVIYKADKNHPLLLNIQNLVRKHLGIENIIETVCENIGEFEKIILLDDYSKGIDIGTIKVLILGENINQDYLENIKLKIEKKINRKIIISVSNEMPKKNYLVVFGE